MSEGKSMPRVEWRDDFATGVESIDHEHREMVGLINIILEKLETDADKDSVADFLGEVYAHIAAHFALEERIMRQKKYDQYDDHKTDHERLLDDIRDIMDAHEDDTYARQKYEFAERLEDWFVEHFKTKDSRLHKRLGI